MSEITKESSEKKGGPYTQTEQDERRKQVYDLHFEKGISALKIADMLNVNRNTINGDIKYLYSQMQLEIGKGHCRDWVKKTFYQLDFQHERLLADLEDCKTVSEKIKIEKILSPVQMKSLDQIFWVLQKIGDIFPVKLDKNEDL